MFGHCQRILTLITLLSFSLGVIFVAISAIIIGIAASGITIRKYKNNQVDAANVSSVVSNLQLVGHNKDLFSSGWLIFISSIGFVGLTAAVTNVYVDSAHFNIVMELLPQFISQIIFPLIIIAQNMTEIMKHVDMLW